MNQSEFAAMTAQVSERSRQLRPAWFKDLLAAKLGLGDTFWIGNFGASLVFVPVGFLLSWLWMVFFGQTGISYALTGLSLFMAVYFLALTRAVFMCARAAPDVVGWRWVGVAITLLNALGAITLLAIRLTQFS